MPIHKLKLLAKKSIANNTLLFKFEKPPGFKFIPGQYGGFTLINPSEVDPAGITRRFSLACAPDDTELAIAMRMQTSVYKHVLEQLTVGDEVKFAGPTGTFILPQDPTVPAVLIAGGIGITPFYSMIKHSVQHEPERQLYLFYGNRSTADTAFIQELQQLATQHDKFTLICTMEQPNGNWQGEVGYITHTLIKKYIADIYEPFYYVCGAPAMVTALQELLAEMGIDENRIKIEDFPGY